MDIELIKELISIVDMSKLSEFQLDTSEYKILMIKGTGGKSNITQAGQNKNYKETNDLLKGTKEEICCTSESDRATSKLNNISQEDKVIIVKSTLVGSYYNYVLNQCNFHIKVGYKVKKRETLCIIKCLNIPIEIKSEVDGEIIEICATEGQFVEYGQILFRIKQ